MRTGSCGISLKRHETTNHEPAHGELIEIKGGGDAAEVSDILVQRTTVARTATSRARATLRLDATTLRPLS
jgi:hypothetical protein